MAGTGLVGVSVTSSGPVHSVFTVTGTSTEKGNSTTHIRLACDPAMTLPEVMFTDVGSGTEEKHNNYAPYRLKI